MATGAEREVVCVVEGKTLAASDPFLLWTAEDWLHVTVLDDPQGRGHTVDGRFDVVFSYMFGPNDTPRVFDLKLSPRTAGGRPEIPELPDIFVPAAIPDLAARPGLPLLHVPALVPIEAPRLRMGPRGQS